MQAKTVVEAGTFCQYFGGGHTKTHKRREAVIAPHRPLIYLCAQLDPQSLPLVPQGDIGEPYRL